MKTGLLKLMIVSSLWAAQPQPPEVISALKDFQRSLGLRETTNFSSRAERIEAYYHCYYTGKLTLPTSYEGLEFREGEKTGCSLDEDKYDVFFYPIEAVATVATPVTSMLEKASVERLAVVVAHEDFHDHEAIEELPRPIAEAASTLIGFLAAAEFARTQWGEDSAEYRNLSLEADLFLRKARLVNVYHARLSRLYAAVRAKQITRGDALSSKRELFGALRNECMAIEPEPHAFNRCPAADNQRHPGGSWSGHLVARRRSRSPAGDLRARRTWRNRPASSAGARQIERGEDQHESDEHQSETDTLSLGLVDDFQELRSKFTQFRDGLDQAADLLRANRGPCPLLQSSIWDSSRASNASENLRSQIASPARRNAS